jgi:hypothetical protein
VKEISPQQHFRERLTLDPALRQLHVEPVSSPLYIVCAMFNPLRFASRYRLYHAFRKHCADAGAILYTVELALRDRHHEVTRFDDPHDIQVRGQSEIWYKENLQNVGTRFLPADAEYVGYVDGDFHFTRSDWATETVQMLQHHEAVQMFKVLSYETYDHDVANRMRGFAFTHCNQLTIPTSYGHKGAVGGAWAFRRSAIRKLGGMLETCILGSADWHMAFGLAMREDHHLDMTHYREIPEYVKSIQRWQERAKVLNGNIGYVEAHAIHHWHGPSNRRGYSTRGQILVDHQYNPLEDIFHDENGVLQLRDTKPRFRDEMRAYFRSRVEDSIIQEVL